VTDRPKESLVTRARWSAHTAVRALREARFPFARPGTVERAQSRRVRAAAGHAYEHVPYYRETMRRLGLGPGDFRTADDLSRLPLIEREDLQRDPQYFVSRAQPIDRYVELRSGGSTGTLLQVFVDPFALFQVGAHLERQRSIVVRLAGRRFRCRQVRIKAPFDTGEETSRAFAARSLVPGSVRLDRQSLSMLDPMERTIQAINELRPDVLDAWGSYVEALFLRAHATGEDLHRPKVVTYGADPLSDPVRRLITEEFGIEVLGRYGAVEAFRLAFECERHRGLHLNVDLYPLRIVDPEGRELADGDSGQVVVSNLVNRGTVLLNYRLGDIARRLPAPCPCGRSLPLLSFLEGRRDDWLETVSGERVHPEVVRTLFGDESEVWSYQVVQQAPTRLRVYIVGAPGCDRRSLRARLERGIAGVLGDVELEARFVDSLPRTAGGKVRSVIREVG
jgi:phenylacetate-CoA ligase